jgi:glutathionylspermidine synthase
VRRLNLEPRPGWQAKAEELGFVWHSEAGPYWDESAAYAFSLAEVETHLEPAAEALHRICLELVEEVVGDEELLTRLAIPEMHWDLVARSWKARDPSLYGRFDFAYDGSGPPKLYEYNADTPTSVFEAAVFQWLWLEDGLASGALPASSDQFNTLYDDLKNRFAAIFPQGGFLHFAGEVQAVEDRQTVRFFEDLAAQAGLETAFVAMGDIGLDAEGRFVDGEHLVLNAAFKLYPWEHMMREPYAAHLAAAGTRWIEPPWKAILSNKGALPLLWARNPGHPNLLPAYFDDDPAAAILGPRYVRKPLYSREGSNIELHGTDLAEPVQEDGYGAEGWIRQAYAPPPEFDGRHAVVGAWIVGDAPAGVGIREDHSRVTKNAARFVPHFIEPPQSGSDGGANLIQRV